MTYYMKKKKEAELLKELMLELTIIKEREEWYLLDTLIQKYKIKLWDIENEKK